MATYTRFIAKLEDAIQEICRLEDISIDTKAIVLVLAVSMSPRKFKAWMEPIDALGSARSRLLEISKLRFQFGPAFRDYTILHALQLAKREINSTELQGYINSSAVTANPSQKTLNPALEAKVLTSEAIHSDEKGNGNFTVLTQTATEHLINGLSSNKEDEANSILNTYLHCRGTAAPMVAYRAVACAMTNILRAGGLDAKQALLHSYKLSKHALSIFLHDSDHDSLLLPTYKSFIS